MKRAGGGKKTKTETELGGREGVLGFHPQVRQGEEEEFFLLYSLGPDPLNPGGGCLHPGEHRLSARSTSH